jgi:hypothetical protein
MTKFRVPEDDCVTASFRYPVLFGHVGDVRQTVSALSRSEILTPLRQAPKNGQTDVLVRQYTLHF